MSTITVGERLRSLRNGTGLSQKKLAEKFKITQAGLHRYEHNQAEAPYKTLLLYADYFDVSLDYIFGRTDQPEGMLYEFKPKFDDNEELRLFIEMCFDPKSPMNSKLKQALIEMLREDK